MGLYSNTDMLMNISDYTFHGQILHENICNPLFFPPKPDKQEMIQAFLGPHICRNLNHGSVGWLQDARTIVPKSSGLICTSYIVTTHTHTRGVLRLLCFDSPVLPSSSSSSSFGSFSSSFPFFLKCHTHRHVRALSHTLTRACTICFLCFCCTEQLLQPKECVEKGYAWLRGLSGASAWSHCTGVLVARCQRTCRKPPFNMSASTPQDGFVRPSLSSSETGHC